MAKRVKKRKINENPRNKKISKNSQLRNYLSWSILDCNIGKKIFQASISRKFGPLCTLASLSMAVTAIKGATTSSFRTWMEINGTGFEPLLCDGIAD